MHIALEATFIEFPTTYSGSKISIHGHHEFDRNTSKATHTRSLLKDRVLEPFLLVPAPNLIRRLPLLRCVVQPSVRHDENASVRFRDEQRGSALAAEPTVEGVAGFSLVVLKGPYDSGRVLRVGNLL